VNDIGSLASFVVVASLGAAFSPTILVLATNILSGSRRPRQRALAFWVGGIVALVLWAGIVYSALWAVFQRAASSLEKHEYQIEIVLGVLLLISGVVALIEWQRLVALRRRHETQKAEDRHDDSPDSLVRIGALGTVMQGRDVSSILLYIAVLGRIAATDVPIYQRFAFNALSIGIVTTVFWLPLLFHITIPKSLRQRAMPLLEWLNRHARAITPVVCFVLGAYLIWHALR